MLSQAAVNRSLKGRAGAVTRRQFCLLIKEVDALHFLVICDAEFAVFLDSIRFFFCCRELGVENRREKPEQKNSEFHSSLL